MLRPWRILLCACALALAMPATAMASPSPTVSPSVSGTPRVGSTLTCDPGTWTGTVPTDTVQTTDYVGQGQTAWFVIQVKAPTTTGSYRIHLRPVIDGVSWLEDYGVYFDLTVVAP